MKFALKILQILHYSEAHSLCQSTHNVMPDYNNSYPLSERS